MLKQCMGILTMVCLLVAMFVADAGAQGGTAPAQQSVATAEPEAPRVVLQAETTASVLRLMKFSGLLRDRAGNARNGAVGLTFGFYKDQQGGAPLWLEVHNAQLDEQGRYTVLLGSTKSEGLPLELFSSGEARWLGVQVNLPGEEEQARVLLVSVPYALKAADAETLGGKPPSAFLLAEKAEGREAAGAKGEAGKAESAKEAVKEGPRREGVVGPIAGEGSINMVARFTGPNNIGNGTIFDNGNVGIGTTSPTARLHIFEPEPTQNANVRLMGSGQTGSWMDIFAGTAVGFGLFGYGAQPFLFGVGAVERMRITPAGNVGVGTTSPNAKLSVGSGSIADANMPVQISTGTSGTVSYYGANKNGGYGLLLGYENGGFFGTGGMVRMVAADPLLFFVNNVTEAMRLTSAGNLGIGTTAPGTKLHTLGTTTLQTDAAANKALVVKAAASQSANLQEWQDSSGNVLASVEPSGAFRGPLAVVQHHASFQGASQTITGGCANCLIIPGDGHLTIQTSISNNVFSDIKSHASTTSPLPGLDRPGAYLSAHVKCDTLFGEHRAYLLAGGTDGSGNPISNGFGLKQTSTGFNGVTILNGTETVVDLATTPCSALTTTPPADFLAIRRTSSVDFYVNGVLKGTSSTNLPSEAFSIYEVRLVNGNTAMGIQRWSVSYLTVGIPMF